MVPALTAEIRACAFADRCPFVTDRCRVERPPLEGHGNGHEVACFEALRVAAAAHV
jgi:peptide/nickel transport system ATP-binding protein